MSRQLCTQAVLGLALLAATASAGTDKSNTTVTFAAGSLIIPGGSQFQDDCGQVSRFGLVYDLLRAQPYFQSTPGGGTPLHIYYAVDNAKKSPNRCIPAWKFTTVNTPVNAPPTSAGSPTYASTWDDGCDFHLPNSGQFPKPATLVHPGSSDTSIVTNNTTSRSSDIYPVYPNATIDTTVVQLGYLGAPFIIDSADATRVIALLAAPVGTAKDASGKNIDFTAFSSGASCSFGSKHNVNIHRSATGFNAYISRDFSNVPPRLALLATDLDHVSTKLFDGILETYLGNANLNFTGSQGCPLTGRLQAATGYCPSPVAHGQIYDLFDVKDLMNDHMSDVESGARVYPMVWAPHWESGSGDSSAFTKLQSYLNNQVGLMGECGSISTLEGAYNGGTADIKAGLQLQTCKNNGSGACDTATTQYGIQRSPPNQSAGSHLRNCSDPNMTTGTNHICAFYAHPTDSFSQIADYQYTWDTGHVTSMIPLSTTSSMYRPGVLPLISYIKDLDTTKLASEASARTIVLSDLHTRSLKDNDPAKANVVYIGGHNQSGNAAGTTLALETLLQLGAVSTATDPPVVSSDVARSSPVVATIEGQTAIVQGSFTSLSTPATPLLVAAVADLATWVFPTVGGHMRARTTSSVTNAASAFSAGTILFDAANGIPTPSLAGCPSNFTTSCRTVFTTIDAPTGATGAAPATQWATALRPANHYFKSSESTAIGSQIISGGLWAVTGWTTLLSRVLAGDLQPDLTFKPKLGGIDHSTAAVIGPSNVVSGTRPQMLYFGAMDGMLHAFCADNTVGACNGGLGKELWAFVPRTNLARLVLNTARLDSSVRVMDMFGDFNASGTNTFHTLMWFGTSSNDPADQSSPPAVIEMDVTDPAAPKVVWEYSLKSPGTGRATMDLGNGLTTAAGVVQIAGVSRNVVWVQTNNGGTSASPGWVVDAIDANTGVQLWRVTYPYPTLHVTTDNAIPKTGLPGGIVGVDRAGNGYITDLVFGDLYGNLFVLDPINGTNKYGANVPLFQYASDYHAIGSAPTIYSSGAKQYAVVVPGGFVDPNDANWGNASQTVVSVSLSTSTANATLTDLSTSTDIGFKLTLGTGEKSFSQAVVIGGQLFITTDTSDVNATATFGTSGTNTGKVYAYTIASGVTSTTSVAGGAGSIANNGTEVYNSSGNAAQRIPTDATSTTGTSVDSNSQQKVSKMLWLRTI